MAYAMYVPPDGPVQVLGRVVMPIRRGEDAGDPSRTVLVLALDAEEAQWLHDQVNHFAVQSTVADRMRVAILVSS